MADIPQKLVKMKKKAMKQAEEAVSTAGLFGVDYDEL